MAVWYGLTDATSKNTSIAHALSARWNNFGAASPEKDGGAIGTFPGSMEVQAHFVAGDDVSALALVRREWGYMLNASTGTGSTFWEGFRSDGSFDYGGTYMSLAHGWGTGPTSALTFYVLGLSPTTAGGAYGFVPHPGDLTHVEGSITLPQGAVTGSWDYAPTAGTLSESLVSPAGSTGTIGVPTYGSTTTAITVNGATVWSAGTFHSGGRNHRRIHRRQLRLSDRGPGGHVRRQRDRCRRPGRVRHVRDWATGCRPATRTAPPRAARVRRARTR